MIMIRSTLKTVRDWLILHSPRSKMCLSPFRNGVDADSTGKWSWRCGLALITLGLAASTASAAISFSNSLSGFTGNSTQPATQMAVAGVGGAGFTFHSTLGFTEDPPPTDPYTYPNIDPTVVFDSEGAHFGSLIFGFEGRNYMRTVQEDYADYGFVAEVTFVTTDIDLQDAYFGLGAGQAAYFRTPDWISRNPSVMYFGETNLGDPRVITYYTNNLPLGPVDPGAVSTPAPELDSGTHRVRLDYNWLLKTATFSFDFDYDGTFEADVMGQSVNVLLLYDTPSTVGWPTEPARIFFGGNDGTVFKDFSVNLTSPKMLMGDFDSSGALTAADWMILHANQYANLSGDTLEQAYFKGDLNLDHMNDYLDFQAFKLYFDAANGVGAFVAMLASVPEPSSLMALLSAGLLAFAGRTRSANR